MVPVPPDDTITVSDSEFAALQARLTEAQSLLEKKEQNLQSVLREKKQLQLKELNGRTSEGIERTKDTIIVPRHLLSSPQEYQKYKSLAAEIGVQMLIS